MLHIMKGTIEKKNKINYQRPFSGMRFIVCGKGGSGKSTIISLMARILIDRGYEVHVLDGDASNTGLYMMLGFEREPESLIEYFGGKTFNDEKGKVTCPVDDPTPLDKDKMDLERIPPEYFVKKDNITLFIAGKINGVYAGCHGPESKVTRDFILAGKHVTLIDIEAGIEHFGRGIEVNTDGVIVVVDPNDTSFQTAEKIEKMTAEIKVGAKRLAERMVKNLGSSAEIAKEVTSSLRMKYAWTILNKVNSTKVESIMREKLKERGIEPIGFIHFDQVIFESSLNGIPFGECKAKEDIKKIINCLEHIVLIDKNNQNTKCF